MGFVNTPTRNVNSHKDQSTRTSDAERFVSTRASRRCTVRFVNARCVSSAPESFVNTDARRFMWTPGVDVRSVTCIPSTCIPTACFVNVCFVDMRFVNVHIVNGTKHSLSTAVTR